MFSDGFRKEAPIDPKRWAQAFLSNVGEFLDSLASVVKNTAFSAENEFRLLQHFVPARDVPKLGFRQTSSLLNRYLPIEFPEHTKLTSRQLPLTDVRVGPSRHQKASEASVEMLLRTMHYRPFVRVSRSPIPFQQT